MDESKLLPCPFCGREAVFEIYEGDEDEYQVNGVNGMGDNGFCNYGEREEGNDNGT